MTRAMASIRPSALQQLRYALLAALLGALVACSGGGSDDTIRIGDPLAAARSGQVPRADLSRRRGKVAGPDLAQVVEHDHAIAEQAPPLLGVRSHGAGGAPVGAVSPRACG